MLHTKYKSFGSCGFREDVFPIISLWPIMTPWGVACMDPMGTFGRIYKGDHYTLLHTKYESSRPCGFGEEDFFSVFSHCKSMGAICCHGNQNSDLTSFKTIQPFPLLNDVKFDCNWLTSCGDM